MCFVLAQHCDGTRPYELLFLTPFHCIGLFYVSISLSAVIGLIESSAPPNNDFLLKIQAILPRSRTGLSARNLGDPDANDPL
jgi:hypothetical protein